MIRWMLKQAATAAVLTGLAVGPSFAQAQKQWIDNGEYELVVNGIGKEANPQKKLQLLQQWREKYPNSNFKAERLQATLQAYQAAGDAAGMKKTAQEMTVEDPKGLIGLVGYTTLNLLTVSMNDKSDAALADGEKAANGLLGILNEVQKPAQVPDDAWNAEKQKNQVLAHRTLGWVAWQRKQYDAAEKHFTDALKVNPANGEISGWMGTVILLQRKPELQAAGLYHFARAASLEGPGALPEAARAQTKAYVEKTYTNFHGSTEGLPEIMARAKTEAFPPADFKIESKFDIEMKNQEKLKAENPMLYKWVTLKGNLNTDAGFFDQMKGSDAGGPFKGKLVSQTPETKPKELVLSMSDGITPEVTLKLDEALPGKADPGTEIEFTGEATAFTKEPFNLTFEVDPAKVVGWPVKAAAPAKAKPAKPAAAKRPAAKKG